MHTELTSLPTRMLTPRERLDRHLLDWLGHWPPQSALDIVVSPAVDRPGWDGATWPGRGMVSPDGIVVALSPVLGIDPAAVDRDRLQGIVTGGSTWIEVGDILGRSGLGVGRPTFRWCEQVPDLPEIGEWVPNDDPRVPSWLRPFNGEVLIAWDRHGAYAAGVGRKQHNAFGHELSVGTEPAFRGRGMASKLVAQAARRVLAEGAVPLYLHGRENRGSARVAELTGFHDRGWHLLHFRIG